MKYLWDIADAFSTTDHYCVDKQKQMALHFFENTVALTVRLGRVQVDN